jgi:hypothetical protein
LARAPGGTPEAKGLLLIFGGLGAVGGRGSLVGGLEGGLQQNFGRDKFVGSLVALDRVPSVLLVDAHSVAQVARVIS